MEAGHVEGFRVSGHILFLDLGSGNKMLPENSQN